ncbi:MAG: hypothetical protein RIG67_20710 [Rhodospirillales bacterium]
MARRPIMVHRLGRSRSFIHLPPKIITDSPEEDFLSSTYQHINATLWQMPAFGLTLFAATLAGAFAINSSLESSIFRITKELLVLIVLFGGAITMFVIARALYRARQYQAVAYQNHPLILKRQGAGLPGPNESFQALMILCAFALFGLGLSSVTPTRVCAYLPAIVFFAAIIAGLVVSLAIEGIYHQYVVEVKKSRNEEILPHDRSCFRVIINLFRRTNDQSA